MSVKFCVQTLARKLVLELVMNLSPCKFSDCVYSTKQRVDAAVQNTFGGASCRFHI